MTELKKDPEKLSSGLETGQDIHYDDLLRQIGEFGRYQKILFVLGNIFSIAACASNMGYVFVADAPNDHWCNVASTSHLNLSQHQIKNLTLPLNDKFETGESEEYFNQCKYYERDYSNMSHDEPIDLLYNNNLPLPAEIECDTWTYNMNPAQRTSIITEWDLVCSKNALAAVSQSVFMAGLVVGALVFGVFSDRFGRRLTLIICTVIFLISYIGTAFSQSYIMFIIMRFLVAFSSNPMFTTWFILSSELVGPSWRVFVGLGIDYFWVVGYVMIAACAYYIDEWWKLQLALSLPFAVCLPLALLMPESPKWMYTSNRKDDADKMMAKIARINRTTLPEKFTVVFDSDKSLKTSDVKTNVYFWDVFRYPVMRIRMLIVFWLWFVVSLSYYGLSLNSTNLSSNKVVSFLLIGMTELPAYIFANLTLDRVGRRPITAGLLILGGGCMLLTLAVPDNGKLEWLVVALTMVGKFGVSATFAILFIYTSELLPTVVRNSGIGVASVFARGGGVLAPQMGLLSGINKSAPMILFGIVAVVAGVASLGLPETAGKIIPETLEEGERFGRHSKYSNDELNSESSQDVHLDKLLAGGDQQSSCDKV